MSLRFDHLMQNAATSASSSTFLAACAALMYDTLNPNSQHPPSGSTKKHSSKSSRGHQSGNSSSSSSNRKQSKQHALKAVWDNSKHKHKKQQHPLPPSLAPPLPVYDPATRMSIYRSYQQQFRRHWNDARPGDLVALEAELRREPKEAALIQTMLHRSVIGECLLDCLSMHWQMTKSYPQGVPHVKYARGGKNGRCLSIPRRDADDIRNPFRSNGSLMVFFLVHLLSRTPQLLHNLPYALRQILFTCCLRTMFAECCSEEAHGAYEAAYCSLGRNLDSMLLLMLHLAVLDPDTCRKVALKHRIPSADLDDGGPAGEPVTLPTLWAVVEWIDTKSWTHPSTCCGGDTTAEDVPLDVVDGFQLSAAALLHALDIFPPHLVSPFKANNLSSILEFFKSKPQLARSAETVVCANCGLVKDAEGEASAQQTTFVRCGGCLCIQYCSAACAKKDWALSIADGGGDHRHSCSRIAKEPTEMLAAETHDHSHGVD